MQATAHIDFIAAAYAAGIFVIAGLIAWVTFDYRAQRRTLAKLEMQGISRRSATPRTETVTRAAKEDA
jgi:heme exporter protein CcmD